ncbi:hypothetical protein IWW36_004677, partial [Coemansia brasiliensis]
KEPTGPVRVRFAPSPTGMLHLGGLRTALFNYLLSRRYGGAFILRIEDTDQTRLVSGATENIINTLKWAGLTFDEGPGHKGGSAGSYFQSQRADIYRKHSQILLDRGSAYRCFCTPGRLESLRTSMAVQGRPPMYDRNCRHLSQRQIDEKLRLGEPYTIRLLAPNPVDQESAHIGQFSDAVHGHMHFRGPAGFDDAVLLKSDGLPTYHLANVVDDHLMGITHVLRGEEWLMSTPKHRALFTAFGWPIPQYAHLPLLMNPDGSKLSKRNRDGPVQQYIDDGYLPSALVNYTALLGWHPENNQELFTLKELENQFSLNGLGRSKSVVSRDRINWLNRQHLRMALNDSEQSAVLVKKAREELANTHGCDDYSIDKHIVHKALDLCCDRLTFTSELFSKAPFMFVDPDLFTSEAKKLLHKVPEDNRASIINCTLSNIQEGSKPEWQSLVKTVAEAAQVPNKQVMMMLRFALTGQSSGPKIPDLLDALPIDTIKRRLYHVANCKNTNV